MELLEQHKLLIEHYIIEDGKLVYKLFREVEYSPEYVKKLLSTVSSDNLQWLLHYQSVPGTFLYNYIQRSDIVINNLLRRKISKLAHDYSKPYKEVTPEIIKRDKEHIRQRILKYSDHSYMPMPPYLVEQIIEIDELFRLSKSWNKQIKVYRGTMSKCEPGGLLSTSSELTSALEFYNGSLWEIDLPDGFPYLDISKTQLGTTFDEHEILLPPCLLKFDKPHEITVTSSYTEQEKKVELTHVQVTPLSLAEELLNVMENPPKDYPQVFIQDPDFGWEESKAILRNYIENYVYKGKIKIGDVILDEFNPTLKPSTMKKKTSK